MKTFSTFVKSSAPLYICTEFDKEIKNPSREPGHGILRWVLSLRGFALLAPCAHVACPTQGLKSRYDEFLSWRLQPVKSNKRAFNNLLPDLSHVILYGNLKIMQWSGKLIPKGGRGLTYFY